MTHPLSKYKPIADAITVLFHPTAEVVIHNIKTDSIFYISNPVSGRKIGDISLLELDGHEFGQGFEHELKENEFVIGPYEKAGEKGQRVRAITAVLKDEADIPMGLMCINQDFSTFEGALDILDGFLRPPKSVQHPEILFQNDWRDQIKLEIRSFLESHDITLEKLTLDIRKKMVAHLDSKGLFFAKKSIDQLATILGVSRATAYNDLSYVRKMKNQSKGL